ncbi:MAG: type II secretion system minor pseudopilin GspI [Wenzhouxiangella sp.]|jgi:general secretion pathway protein I|nr:type II secretion system minor pseudopilin GspI [Wenzhouxiangella sp.]
MTHTNAQRYRVGKRGSRAFTLLEVLVALVVVAIAVAALARAGSQALDGQFQAEQRTMALWVADNVLAELRLDPPERAGRRQGSQRMGGRDWYWEGLIQPAPGEDMQRVDVAVFADARRDQPVLTHTGFLPL